MHAALRGNQLPLRALADINQTADHARLVAHQMLALAKFEQLRRQHELKTFNQAKNVQPGERDAHRGAGFVCIDGR